MTSAAPLVLKGKLEALEEIVEKHIKSALQAGATLAAIRRDELYKATHKTWSEYLADRWGITRSYASRLNAAYQVVEALPMGDVMPINERQARPLRVLKEEERGEAWAEAVEAAGGKQPTNIQVQDAVNARRKRDRVVMRADNSEVIESASDNSDQRYTQKRYIEAVKSVFGGKIALDAASCALANQVVGAERFFDVENDGLVGSWKVGTFCNPPYSKPAPWIEKAIDELLDSKAVSILLVPGSTADQWFQPLWDFPLCFVDHRMFFDRPDGSQVNPVRNTVFALVGGSRAVQTEFLRSFKSIGNIVLPVNVRRSA